MAKYTQDQILTIHRNASATESKKYYTVDGKVYIGLDTGHLKRQEVLEIESEQQQQTNTEDISDIRESIISLEAKHDADIDATKCFAIAMSMIL